MISSRITNCLMNQCNKAQITTPKSKVDLTVEWSVWTTTDSMSKRLGPASILDPNAFEEHPLLDAVAPFISIVYSLFFSQTP